jgi:hypothetical protein
VKNGRLDKPYAKAARKGWLGLVSYLTSHRFAQRLPGAGKKANLQYYLDRARLTGNRHRQAPVLWYASGMAALNIAGHFVLGRCLHGEICCAKLKGRTERPHFCYRSSRFSKPL